jgi:aryl-alcohol dehydrogenase-like predicted oxidoreductase
MRFRTYKNTDLTISEVGFGLWTFSTGWWGNLPSEKQSLTFNTLLRSWSEFRDYFLEARIAAQRIPAWVKAEIAI